MKVFHRRTRKENIHLFWQSILVFLVILAFMYALKKVSIADAIVSAIGATSLGSSAFLAFVAHDTAMARPRRMISGYALGIVVGVFFSLMFRHVTNCNNFDCHSVNSEVLFAAGAAIVTMWLMAFFSSEHPPAIGIAIGLVLWSWKWPVLVVIMGAVLVIALLRYLLRPWLINLL